VIALGTVQDEAGDIEEGVGAPGKFDLTDERIDTLGFGRNANFDIGERDGGFAWFRALEAIIAPGTAPISSEATTVVRAAGASGATPAVRTAAVTPITPIGTVTAAPFELRKRARFHGLLRPGGEEVQLEIETGIGRLAHVFLTVLPRKPALWRT